MRLRRLAGDRSIEPSLPAHTGASPLMPDRRPRGSAFGPDGPLDALRLPDAWRGAAEFTVLALAFGCGEPFLAALRAWRDDPGRCARLRWAALLDQPIRAHALRETLGALRVPSTLVDELVAAWPAPLPGIHRIAFDGGRALLWLAVGPPRSMLPGWLPAADAVLVPVGAEGAIDPPVLRAALALLPAHGRVAVVAAPGASPSDTLRSHRDRSLGTLAGAGFETDRDGPSNGPGAGTDTPPAFPPIRARRRHGLAATPPPRRAERDRQALVIGDGLAGCAAAYALARRGWSVVRVGGGRGDLAGSMQPALAHHPSITPDDAPMSRLTRAASLLATSAYDPGLLQRVGRVQCMEVDRAQAASRNWPVEWVEAIDPIEASARAGVRLRHGGLWLPRAAIADPMALCDAWTLAGVRAVGSVRVARIERRGPCWVALAAEGDVIAEGAVVIIATGAGDLPLGPSIGTLHEQFGPAGLSARRATTTLARTDDGGWPRCIVGGAGHVMPLSPGRVLLGPVQDDQDGVEPSADTDRRPDAADAPIRAWSRYTAQRIGAGAPLELAPGRTGVRLSTRDHLPLIGPVPDARAAHARSGGLRRDDRLATPVVPDAWVATAFGGRGLLWSVIAAEILAARLENEPAAIDSELSAAVAPDRFLRRALRRTDTSG
jgi:tRNA 5-methylaminomethyl-2-thiouridine biosynthesis bifunctional protein